MPARIVELLDSNKVQYEVLSHLEAFTAQELAQLEHVKGRFHAKVVLVRCGGETIMLVLPTDHRVDLEKLEAHLHQPVEIEPEKDFKPLFPDCALGKMPPFGKLYGLPTLIDKSLMKNESIVFEAGTHTDAVKMKTADYLGLAQGEVGDFSEKLQPMKAL